jgi:hypothetical protein
MLILNWSNSTSLKMKPDLITLYFLLKSGSNQQTLLAYSQSLVAMAELLLMRTLLWNSLLGYLLNLNFIC